MIAFGLMVRSNDVKGVDLMANKNPSGKIGKSCINESKSSEKYFYFFARRVLRCHLGTDESTSGVA